LATKNAWIARALDFSFNPAVGRCFDAVFIAEATDLKERGFHLGAEVVGGFGFGFARSRNPV